MFLGTETGKPSAICLFEVGEKELVGRLKCPGAIGPKELQLEILHSKGNKINLVPREIVEQEAAFLPRSCFFQKFGKSHNLLLENFPGAPALCIGVKNPMLEFFLADLIAAPLYAPGVQNASPSGSLTS